MEAKLHELYTLITQKINEMIPEKWSHVIVYAEISDEMSNVSFYYYTIKSDTPTYYTEIWDKLGVDYHEFNLLHRELIVFFKQLRQTFIDHDQEPWTNLTMRFDATGKFSIEYHYDDFTDIDPYTTVIMWKHMIAQVPLHDTYEMETVNEYVDYLHKKNWLYNNRPVERIKIE